MSASNSSASCLPKATGSSRLNAPGNSVNASASRKRISWRPFIISGGTDGSCPCAEDSTQSLNPLREPVPPTNLKSQSLSSTQRPSVTGDRKSTRLNSSHQIISYAVFCLKKKQDDLNTHPSPP